MEKEYYYLLDTKLMFLKLFLINDNLYLDDGSPYFCLSYASSFFNHSPKQALIGLQAYQRLLRTKFSTVYYPKAFGGEEDIVKSSIPKKPSQEQISGASKVLDKLSQCKIIEDIIRQKDLLNTIDDEDTSYDSAIMIISTLEGNFKDRVQKFIDLYLNQYELGHLTLCKKPLSRKNNIYSQEINKKFLIGLFKELKDYDQRFLTVSKSDLFGAAQKYINPSCSFNEIRPIENLMLLERKGYLKIKGMNFEFFSRRDNPRWNIEIAMVSSIEEIESIEGQWIAFGSLALREDSGHAINGDIRKHMSKDKPPFKALVKFVGNPETKFTFREIEEFSYGDKTPEKNLETRIKNLISKGIIEPLQMNRPSSRVNIIGSGKTYFLTAIPSRK